MKFVTILGLILFATQPTSFAQQSSCDESYSKRAESFDYAEQAYECYRNEFMSGTQASKLDSLEGAALSAVWIVNRTKNSEEKAKWTFNGQVISELILKIFPNHGAGQYWKAVFLTFDAKNKDGNSILPKNMLMALPAIKQNLIDAKKLNENVHAHGPHRVYGIMHMQMPTIVGGDDQIALQDLRLAYVKDPLFSANIVAYAKILIKTNDTMNAKNLLTDFLSSPVNDFGINRIADTNEDRVEAQNLLNKIVSR